MEVEAQVNPSWVDVKVILIWDQSEQKRVQDGDCKAIAHVWGLWLQGADWRQDIGDTEVGAEIHHQEYKQS